jgi:hypothetical protein
MLEEINVCLLRQTKDENKVTSLESRPLKALPRVNPRSKEALPSHRHHQRQSQRETVRLQAKGVAGVFLLYRSRVLPFATLDVAVRRLTVVGKGLCGAPRGAGTRLAAREVGYNTMWSRGHVGEINTDGVVRDNNWSNSHFPRATKPPGIFSM